MKRNLLFLLLLIPAFNIWATDVPKLLILTTTGGEVHIPISTVQKITYNEAGTTMYVATTSGTQSYAVADVTRMTLNNVPETTSLNPISFPVGEDQAEATKFEKDGVVYIIQDGKIYTMKGEQL